MAPYCVPSLIAVAGFAQASTGTAEKKDERSQSGSYL